MSDSLPANTSFVSVTGHDGFVCTGTGSINCTLASLGLGASATITYVVKVDPSFTGAPVSNTATVATTGTFDPTRQRQRHRDDRGQPSADIVVTKDDGDGPKPAATPTTVIAGNNLTYTLSITNGGPSDAQTVGLSDPLPAGTTFVSLTQDTGPAFTCTTPTVGANGTVTCSLARWPPAPARPSPSSSTSTRTHPPGRSPTPPPARPRPATRPPPTTAPPSRRPSSAGPTSSITKTDSPSPVTAGNNLTYTITVTNTSTAANGTTATGITVSDSLPANTSFVSVTGHDGFVCTGTGSISCTLASLGVGASATITYVVKVDPRFTGAVRVQHRDRRHDRHLRSRRRQRHRHRDHRGRRSADLSVTKTDGQTRVTAGDGVTYTYTIIVTNGGPSTATGVSCPTTGRHGFTPRHVTARGRAPASGAGPDFTCTSAPSCPAARSRSP